MLPSFIHAESVYEFASLACCYSRCFFLGMCYYKLLHFHLSAIVWLMLSLLFLTKATVFCSKYRKIPKISPSVYKPPKLVTQKVLRLIAPPNISSPGACTRKIALKYKVKQSTNGKFTSNYKASPIDFETQISLRR